MKEDKIIKLQQKLIAKEKDNFVTIIKYLTDHYYFDCNKKITIEKIKTSLKIEDSKLLEEFIKYLRNNKYIKGKKQFTITFEGFVFLEELRMKYNEYENNFSNVIIAVGALLISYCAATINNMILKFIFVVVTMYGVFYFLDEILKKRYK